MIELQLKNGESQTLKVEKKEPECNRCGKCCQAFVLPFPHDFLDQPRKEFFDKRRTDSFDFKGGDLATQNKTMVDFLKPISLAEAEKSGLNPAGIFTNKAKGHKESFYYSCDLLKMNSEGISTCSVHEHRPDICRSYKPFQGDPANRKQSDGCLVQDSNIIHAECSYLGFWDEEK